ncbi:MAG TPA: dihydropteroate synthase [Bacteroidota bacterium]
MPTATTETERFIFRFGNVEYAFSTRTHIMGILNVTPDSFSDGGRYSTTKKAVAFALKMVEDGADFIDIGGESTRPGSNEVPIEEELRRVMPVIEQLAKRTSIPISVDTYKSQVAEKALNAGATIVNDISGGTFDSQMFDVIREHHASVILMHMKGTPKTMQEHPAYENVTKEVYQFLAEQAQKARAKGIQQIIVDPGIGFGKNLQHNVQLLKELSTLKAIGCPVLVGPSRKSFIGAILDLPVSERLEGTAAAVTASILNGAHLVRVHDVKEMKRVAKMADALKAV